MSNLIGIMAWPMILLPLLLLRLRNHPQVSLLLAIMYGYQTIFTIMLAAHFLMFVPGVAKIVSLFWVALACMSARIAKRHWDNWRNSRRPWARRAVGRVALRLGRLVVLPSNI